MAFDDLGALILGDHALHLQEQVVFRALAQGTVQEHDLHPGTSELIDQQHLVGVFAGQAIRRVDIEPVHTARGDHIAQALQRRADQRRPAIAFVKKLHGLGHGQAIGGDALAQGGHLARDGLRLGLLLRRHAGVDRHLRWIHECCLPPTCCVRWCALSRPCERVPVGQGDG